VENVYPTREELEKILSSGKKLRIYCGIDPTGKLHIGHAAVLGKLRQFQDLGHEVIVLIGDFTATIGDPTGKSETRKPLTRKQVLENAKNYKNQIKKILDLKKLRFTYNGDWTNKLKPIDFLNIASNFTVARLLERDMFQERIKAGHDIHLHEFLYPVLQAYDSVAMDVDMEIGGNDQTFNMLAGRTLMRKMKDKEKFVMTTKLLTDPTGKKMGKSEGNMINLDDNPNDMYGKIMSWPDTLIALGFEVCTNISLQELEDIKSKLSSGGNPRNIKATLASKIVEIYHGQNEAQKAGEEFDKIFRDKEMPTDIDVVKKAEIPPLHINVSGSTPVLDLLVDMKLVDSKSEAKRLVEGGAVTIIIGDKETKIKDWKEDIKLKDDMIVKAGKRKFKKFKL
jgi:tyrosyl-tRNA synthetase